MIQEMRKMFNKAVKPKTVVGGDKKQKLFFGQVDRNMQKWENIYRKGGLVAQAIDAYPLFGLSSGYELEGAPSKVNEVEKWFKSIEIDEMMWCGWVDSLVYGDGIQENVMSRKGEVLYVVPRNPKYFTIDVDQWGMVTSYTQRSNSKETVLKPEQVTNLSLYSISGEPYGQSLLGRAIDDIMRDTRTAESTAVAIERHGYPRFHIKAGDENNDYSDEDKKSIASEFEELKADNEFITDPDIEILPIDVAGVDKVKDYNEWSLSRLLGALGVPSEVIGTGQNVSTYATASVEMVSFLKKVETHQRKVAKCYNNLISLKLGAPDIVEMTFNPIDKEGLSNVESNKE